MKDLCGFGDHEVYLKVHYPFWLTRSAGNMCNVCYWTKYNKCDKHDVLYIDCPECCPQPEWTYDDLPKTQRET